MKDFFITAIGTDSGKTLVSAIIVEVLKADYWKPVQAGEPTDTNRLRELVSNEKTRFHSESFFLKMPASPHAAAKDEGIDIRVSDFDRPDTKERLVIEGAGGILVPLNDEEYVIDIAQKFGTEVILVSNLYLGSINHTLLSIEHLKQRNINVKGIVFNGEPNPESEKIILLKSGWPLLFRVPVLEEINKEVISEFAESIAWEKIL